MFIFFRISNVYFVKGIKKIFKIIILVIRDNILLIFCCIVNFWYFRDCILRFLWICKFKELEMLGVILVFIKRFLILYLIYIIVGLRKDVLVWGWGLDEVLFIL